MRNSWVIAKREFRSYFDSPIAYVAISVFLIIAGVLFFFGKEGGKPFFEMNEATLRPLFTWVPLIFVFYLPAISMRLLSEERRSGTIELLATMPVRDGEIIFGKYLAALGFLAVTLLLTIPYPIVVATIGAPDWGPIIGGYLGLFLVGAVYLGVGLMTSVWTKDQIISFVLALLICGFLYFIDKMAEGLAALSPVLFAALVLGLLNGLLVAVYELLGVRWRAPGYLAALALATLAGVLSEPSVATDLFGAAPEWLPDVFNHLSMSEHFQNIARGVIDTRDLVFYGSLIAASLLVASYSLQSRRWQS